MLKTGAKSIVLSKIQTYLKDTAVKGGRKITQLFVKIRCIDLVNAGTVTDKPNTRRIGEGEDIDHEYHRKAKDNLRNGKDLLFNISGHGILIFSRTEEYNEKTKELVLNFENNDNDDEEVGDGIADGGHTYEIVREVVEAGECPVEQEVWVEVITNLNDAQKREVVVDRNQVYSVRIQSILNRMGLFHWIKEKLISKPYAQMISYYETEKKKIRIADIVRYIVLMCIKDFPVDIKDSDEIDEMKQPIDYYNRIKLAFEYYAKNIIEMMKMAPVLQDILFLRDYIHMKAKDGYNKETGGNACANKSLYKKVSKKYKLPFMDKSCGHILHESILCPLLTAGRQFLGIKNGQYCWKIPFEDVLKVYDEVLGKMMDKTLRRCEKTYGGIPMQMGRDSDHYASMFRIMWNVAKKLKHKE